MAMDDLPGCVRDGGGGDLVVWLVAMVMTYLDVSGMEGVETSS